MYQTCKQLVAHLIILQVLSKVGIHLELCFWPPDEWKSNIHLPSTLLAL